MKLILDARALRMYPVGLPGFTGGTEQYVREIAAGLARTHTVHVVTPDLQVEEQRGQREWWWPPAGFPHAADAVVMFHSLEFVADYAADFLVMATNGVDPDLGPEHAFASAVDAFPVFSKKHGELLCKLRPTVPEDKLYVTGLGVRLEDYEAHAGSIEELDDGFTVPGRLLYANDPSRGLWHVLDIYDRLRPLVPGASLHVAYDFDRQFEHHRWSATAMAEVLWECRRRIDSTPGVENLGAVDRAGLIREQVACQVHAMPSDPVNVGSQIHGMTQMECAAAGCALVLSDTEAFREIFGDAATILPLPGTFLAASERRYDAQDWAECIAAIMEDREVLEAQAKASRDLASRHTWGHVTSKWNTMLAELTP